MSSCRWIVLLVAILWIAANVRSISTMCYDWDAAQYSLGTVEYSLAKHQPHPPGYPLWVLSLKALAPLTRGAPLAQTVLDIALTLGALFCFHRLACVLCGERTAVALTFLLGVSPPVQLYAFAQSNYPVDLFASAWLGWLAWRMWQGDVVALRIALPAAALLMGFRPSGVLMLAPLLAVASMRGFSRRPKTLVAPLLAAVLIFGAWFWPLQKSVGGVGALMEMNRALFGETAGATSTFLGAPEHVGLRITARLTLILGVALVPLVGLVLPGRARTSRPWGFLALWIAPGLLFVYLIHFAKPGYLLLILPPLFLALGAVRPARRTVLAGLVAAEVLALAPYDRLPENKLTRAIALSTPYAAATTSRANSILRQQISRLQPANIICKDEYLENAPNVRTVAYDFRHLAGRNAPVHLVRGEATGPAGTRLVYRGERFALWQ